MRLEFLPNTNGDKYKRRYPQERYGTSGPVILTVPDSIMEAETLVQEVCAELILPLELLTIARQTLVNAGVPYARNPVRLLKISSFKAKLKDRFI